MRFFIKISNFLSLVGIFLSAILLIYILIQILLEIVLRVFFNSSTHIAGEFVGYAVGGITFLSLAYTERKNGLIRVNFLKGFLNSKWRNFQDFICLTLVFFSSSFTLHYLWKIVIRDFERGRLSIGLAQIPTWIPQSILLLGLLFFTIQLLASIAILIYSPEKHKER